MCLIRRAAENLVLLSSGAKSDQPHKKGYGQNFQKEEGIEKFGVSREGIV